MHSRGSLGGVVAMLTRKRLPQKQEKDWFYFSSALALVLVSDYIALRLLYYLEPLTTAHAVLGKAIDVAEKSLKLLVIVSSKSQTALSSSRNDYGHDIEKLRAAAATYNAVFDEVPIKQFARDLNDKSGKLYQHIRYGSEETTDGFEANLAALMPVIDRIFIQAVLALPKPEQKLLFFVSPLKHLVMGSQFDQTQNRGQVLESLRYENVEFPAFEALCTQMDIEHEEFLKQMAESTKAVTDA
jgi:hypothetical protein